ncbi:MAG: hypothetical protein U1C51_04845 [Candidatus Izemoplasmatales bacterium]|nr:hypothetical protein [bacterium]MDZ4196561.1 hypothetical protein [Candidatus Izemoplasmatales bacterium]
MKKTMLALLLCLIILSGGQNNVHAQMNGLLPGGKNYINSSLFVFDGNGMMTSSYTMIKPHIPYTVSIPTSYYQANGEVHISVYDDGTYIDDYSLINADFFISSDPNYYFATLTFPTVVNYVSFYLTNPSAYFTTHSTEWFQMEEGTTFTGFEPFIPGHIIDTQSTNFGPYSLLRSNVDSPLTILDIMEAFLAHDAIVGDVSSRIQIGINEYSGNEQTVGTYAIELMVIDDSMNQTSKTISIQVIDITSPVITGPIIIAVSYPQVRTLESILAMITVSDNVDGDLHSSIQVIENKYHSKQLILGEYPFIVSVEDSSGNVSTFQTTIQVIDQEAPIISAPNQITVGYRVPLRYVELLALATAHDNHDGNVTNKIQIIANSYYANPYQVGEFSLTYKVTDTAGNISQKVLVINVVDNQGPILYFDTQVIAVYNNTYLTLANITEMFIKSNLLANRAYQVTVKQDHYTKHYKTPGRYHMELSFEDEFKDTKTYLFQVLVKDSNIEIIDPIIQNPLFSIVEFFTKNWSYITTGMLGLGVILSNVLWWKLKPKK